jgi:hypothetical protein
MEVRHLARNRCSYEKRAKEIARKQKQEEKTKRRQNKLPAKDEEENLETLGPEEELTEIEETPLEEEK